MKSLADFTWQKISKGMFFICLLLLPFINILHVSTFLLIALAVISLSNKSTYQVNFKVLLKQPLFWICLLYYILQLIQYINLPVADNRFAIEQKASLILMPALFFVLSKNHNLWQSGKTAFIAGNVLAAVFCLFLALKRFIISADEFEFFYHKLSNGIGQGAIYFTLYLLVAMFYCVSSALKHWQTWQPKKFYLYSAISGFFYINILLLSSKMLIVAGSILVFLLVIKGTEVNIKRKFAFFAVMAFLATAIFSTNNPVSERYRAVNLNIFTSALTQNQFKNFPFDGLNFRMFLLRMGCEIIKENKSVFTGSGGKNYHALLNKKIIAYGLYTGHGKNDSGYINYNLHNQYMESFVQSGLIGLLLIFALILNTYYFAYKNKNHILKFIIVLFAIVFLTESVLETQAGILLVTMFISGEWIASLQKRQLAQTA